MPRGGELFEPQGIFSRRVRYDYLFEMETWLKGLEAFFDIENLPLAPEERARAAIRNYVDEIGVARDALAHLERVAQKLLGEGKEDFASFVQYLEKQIRRSGLDPARKDIRLAAAEVEIASVIEAIGDFVRVFDELSRSRYIGVSTFSAAGRLLLRGLRDDRNLGVMFREDLFPVFDSVDKRTLARVLNRLSDRKARRELATLFVNLFKVLHYTSEAADLIPRAATRRRALVLFARIRQMSESLIEYIHSKLLSEERSESARASALDRLVFATEMEMKKVMEGELVDVARLRDSRMAQERMENACGILRDLFEGNILALAEAYTGPVDARRIFPDHLTRRQQSLSLREQLWNLVIACRRFQESGDRRSFEVFIEGLAAFRRGSMRYLMYKDWSAFERFASGFARERSIKTFLTAAHQFEIFSKTLIREVGKRQVLSDRPFESGRGEKSEELPSA